MAPESRYGRRPSGGKRGRPRERSLPQCCSVWISRAGRIATSVADNPSYPPATGDFGFLANETTSRPDSCSLLLRSAKIRARSKSNLAACSSRIFLTSSTMGSVQVSGFIEQFLQSRDCGRAVARSGTGSRKRSLRAAASESPPLASRITGSEAKRSNRSREVRHHRCVISWCAATIRSRLGQAARWLTTVVSR